MRTKLKPADCFPSAAPADDCDFEWLLCLSSTYQTTRRWLLKDGRSKSRGISGNRVIPARSLREQMARDLPADARAPIKSPFRMIRGTSRKRLAG